MGPVAVLIYGIPFLVAVVALLVILRRERRREQGGGEPNRWLPVYRVVAVAIVLFIGWIAVSLIVVFLDPGAAA